VGGTENAVEQVRHVKLGMERQRVNRRTAYLVSRPFSVTTLESLTELPSDQHIAALGSALVVLDPSPTPNAGAKRDVLPPAQVRQQLCPAGMIACPVQPKGYEVSDPWDRRS
jgi:hypothetical protein